jgi:fructose-1,6-bisphosphatase/inositol monophosphatase family enzyme
MPIEHPQAIIDRLIAFQKLVRDVVVASHQQAGLHEVARSTAADTIYKIDTDVDPILERFCEEWGQKTPLVLVAEGLEDDAGNEIIGGKVFPAGVKADDCPIRLIVDPIDGTRGIMYDKRPAWALAGVAPNHGAGTTLRHIEVAVMTELPTSKMGSADVLWAIRGHGAKGYREDLRTGGKSQLKIAPSGSDRIDHGFAMIANFFPGTKVLASEAMEFLVRELIGAADVTRATVFDDQYISTGGQFYELIVGHDRFNADLRPIFYQMQKQPAGLCCHPYDCATLLIAEEAGVIVTDGYGLPLDGPLDTTTGLSWAGFANRSLYEKIQPLLKQFLSGGR